MWLEEASRSSQKRTKKGRGKWKEENRHDQTRGYSTNPKNPGQRFEKPSRKKIVVEVRAVFWGNRLQSKKKKASSPKKPQKRGSVRERKKTKARPAEWHTLGGTGGCSFPDFCQIADGQENQGGGKSIRHFFKGGSGKKNKNRPGEVGTPGTNQVKRWARNGYYFATPEIAKTPTDLCRGRKKGGGTVFVVMPHGWTTFTGGPAQIIVLRGVWGPGGRGPHKVRAAADELLNLPSHSRGLREGEQPSKHGKQADRLPNHRQMQGHGWPFKGKRNT